MIVRVLIVQINLSHEQLRQFADFHRRFIYPLTSESESHGTKPFGAPRRFLWIPFFYIFQWYQELFLLHVLCCSHHSKSFGCFVLLNTSNDFSRSLLLDSNVFFKKLSFNRIRDLIFLLHNFRKLMNKHPYVTLKLVKGRIWGKEGDIRYQRKGQMWKGEIFDLRSGRVADSRWVGEEKRRREAPTYRPLTLRPSKQSLSAPPALTQSETDSISTRHTVNFGSPLLFPFWRPWLRVGLR